jgi:tetratricopeptide (TPR) repeat protein
MYSYQLETLVLALSPVCLALVLSGQEKYEEAEEVHRQTLKLREKVLGKEHPSTLSSMSNLALVLRDQGNYKEAEEMHRQTLELKEKVFGKEHPSTLSSMSSLALVLSDRGKYEEAEEMQRQMLELDPLPEGWEARTQERVYFVDHNTKST